jgi:hypothetical protein
MFCITCGKPLEGLEVKQYCCSVHEAAFQANAAKNRERPIHDQPYGSVSSWFYDRDTGQPINYPASKYGEAYIAPPNPYL